MPARVAHAVTHNDLTEHVGYIKSMVDRSIREGGGRKLALQIVNDVYDVEVDPRTGKEVRVVRAWGKTFLAPPGDVCRPKLDECEIDKIWDFMVLNCRYVFDPADIDTFATLKETLLSGGGDCFPAGTLMLREDGTLVPVEQLEVGDRVHDGTKFVDVRRTWARGPKRLLQFSLNNGSTLTLSDTHKLLRVPPQFCLDAEGHHTGRAKAGRYQSAEECRADALKVGDDLLQPREFGGGSVNLHPDIAFLVGAYLAEGCCIHQDTSGVYRDVRIAGIPQGKGIREQVVEILRRQKITFREWENQIGFAVADVPILAQLGRTALDKHLPHLNWDPATTAIIVDAMELGDGSFRADRGGAVRYSTVSYELALQYRVLKRQLGYSTHISKFETPTKPIYRVDARAGHVARPWARISTITEEVETRLCYDIDTASGRVYLPESDVIVRQCDDATIAFAALLGSIGFRVLGRVISTSKAPNVWQHIYPLVGVPKEDPKQWIPLDITVEGSTPGWEYEDIGQYVDYVLV